MAEELPDLMTAVQVSVATGISVSTLHHYAARRGMGQMAWGPPHVQLGPRCRRWSRSDVVAWLDTCRVGDVR